MTKFLPNTLLHPEFDKFMIGFDDQFRRLQAFHDDLTKNIPNYPPYNIKKVDDTHYVIELAVAGFGKNEIEIEMNEGKLIVKGNVTTAEPDDAFLFKGIAARAFTRTFALDDKIEVKDAELLNGMLKIFLEKLIPEEKKAKKVPVRTMTEGEKDEVASRL